jgi:hypothetical protein
LYGSLYEIRENRGPCQRNGEETKDGALGTAVIISVGKKYRNRGGRVKTLPPLFLFEYLYNVKA